MVAFDLDLTFLALKLFTYYSIFYVGGYFINLLKHLSTKNIPHINIWNWVVFVIAAGIFVFISLYFKGIYYYSDTNIKQLIIRVVGSFSASIFIILGCYFLSKKLPTIISIISVTGRYSLEVYYLHILFLRLPFFNNFASGIVTDVGSQIWNCIWIVLVLLAMCAATIAILYLIPFINIVVFGKSKSIYKFERNILEKNVVGRVFLL